MKYGLQFAGAKRVRRDWGATVLSVVALLAVAALAGWLWSCVRGAMLDARCSMLDLRIQSLASSNQHLVAMAPVWQGTIIGLTLFGLVLLVFLAVRKVQADADFFAALRESEKESERRREFWENGGWPHDVPSFTDDPQIGGMIPSRFSESESCLESASSADGLPPEELRRIVGALIVETCQARDYVRKAQGDLSVEDYGAKLAAAEASLHLCIGCLGGLLDRCDPQIGGRIPSRFSESEIGLTSAKSADDEGREA